MKNIDIVTLGRLPIVKTDDKIFPAIPSLVLIAHYSIYGTAVMYIVLFMLSVNTNCIV